MKNDILISIIVVNFNGIKFLGTCLNSIFLEKNNLYEVIVVDNGTQKKIIVEFKKKYTKEKRLYFINLKKNIGPAGARNIGATASKGKYLLFLDYDAQIKKGWFKETINLFNRYKDVGGYQPKILKKGTDFYDYAGDYLSPLGFLIERARGVKDEGQFDQIVPIFSAKGACMIIKKNIFENIGGFDNDYRYLWEEPDLTWRIWLAGYKVMFTPTITVWHAYVTKEKNTQYYEKSDVTYLGSRNNVLTLIKNLELKNAIYIIPLNIFSLFILSLLFFLRLNFYRSYSIIRGITWNIKNISITLKKRQKIQQSRKVGDSKIFKIIMKNANLLYYLGKGISYILGKPY
ncbi:MAG: glycosyltransferase family 2 protein [Candidatus Roizmanbacteria bacterium]|nr:MAG: glycosyltransferase family 2 protein [Candidatus Roizmanbacteria bacterium]